MHALTQWATKLQIPHDWPIDLGVMDYTNERLRSGLPWTSLSELRIGWDAP